MYEPSLFLPKAVTTRWVIGPFLFVAALLSLLSCTQTACASAIHDASKAKSNEVISSAIPDIGTTKVHRSLDLTTDAPTPTNPLSFYAFDVTGDTVAYFKNYLCSQTGAECSSITVTVTKLSAQPSTSVCHDAPTRACFLVYITGSCWAIPALTNYVNDVRTAYLVQRGGLNPWGGNSSASVTASMVVLETRTTTGIATSTTDASTSIVIRRVTLYDSAEYTNKPRTIITCNSSTGMWAFSLLVLLPFIFFFMRYAWYRGRRASKEKERLLVIADERRNMQSLEDMRLGTGDVPNSTLPHQVPPPGMSALNTLREGDVVIDDESESNRKGVAGGQHLGGESVGSQEQQALDHDTKNATSQPGDQASQQKWMMDENGDYYTVDEEGNYYKYDKNAVE